MCHALGVILCDASLASNGQYDGHDSSSEVCSQPSHCWGQAGAVRKCLGCFGGTLGIVMCLEHPGMVTVLIPLWALALQYKKGFMLWAGPALNQYYPWHHRVLSGWCSPAPVHECVSLVLPFWGLFGINDLAVHWTFLWLAVGFLHRCLLAWDMLLKIFVHRFLCLGLGSNVLLGAVSFAHDKISHPLLIPSVMLSTSSALTLCLSVIFLCLAQLYTLTSHYRLSTDRCGTETHREPTPPSMVALFPVRFLFFIISRPHCAVQSCKVHRSPAHACSILLPPW